MLRVDDPPHLPMEAWRSERVGEATIQDYDTFLSTLRGSPRGGMDAMGLAFEHLQPLLANAAQARSMYAHCDQVQDETAHVLSEVGLSERIGGGASG